MGKNNQNKNGRYKKEITYIRLPYDFIDFPESWVSISEEQLPPHNDHKGMSGYVAYHITPESDFALEVREAGDKCFISGSNIRGRVRINAEILSQNYPRFIDRTPIWYRDIANQLGCQKKYEKKLGVNGRDNKIEKAVSAGYLRKEGKEFYVVEATKFKGGENFLAKKEEWILTHGQHILDAGNRLKTSNFIPYEKPICYRLDKKGEIYKIENSKKDYDGYLYNSTNAGTKEKHYIINRPGKNAMKYYVSDQVIQSYKCYFDKIKVKDDRIEEFYNIFEKYEKLDKNKKGLIVFFQTDDNDKGRIKSISRTPYLKVPYKYTVGDCINKLGPESIGYADALFGFVKESEERKNNEESSAYKSRVRFSAVELIFKEEQKIIKKQEKRFLLMKPQASACGMYLKQKGQEALVTYETDEINKTDGEKKSPSLNGYKFYHILKEPDIKEFEDIAVCSNKFIIEKKNIKYLKGKVYFKNLSSEELGLLLLSLEAGVVSDNNEIYCEQMGGAKAYGYGKVIFHIEKLYIEKNGNSLTELLSPYEDRTSSVNQYAENFLTKMEKCTNGYRDYLRRYLNSKRIDDKKDSNKKTWHDLKQEGKGYQGRRLYRDSSK